jgi:hypothetical protein
VSNTDMDALSMKIEHNSYMKNNKQMVSLLITNSNYKKSFILHSKFSSHCNNKSTRDHHHHHQSTQTGSRKENKK